MPETPPATALAMIFPVRGICGEREQDKLIPEVKGKLVLVTRAGISRDKKLVLTGDCVGHNRHNCIVFFFQLD